MEKENNQLADAHKIIWRKLEDGVNGKTIVQDRFVRDQVELLDAIYVAADSAELVTEEMEDRQNRLNESTYRKVSDLMKRLDQA